MDGSDTTIVALAGIIATAVTGVMGPIVTVFIRRLDVRTSREEELRAVIESAAISLGEAIQQLDRLRAQASAETFDSGLPESTVQQLWRDLDRLEIRIGPDAPESTHFKKAVGAVIDASGGFARESESQRIVESRTEAFDEGELFKAAAARRLSPDATPCARRKARRAGEI